MAVAAYGSLLSLIHVLDNVHYRAELRRLHVDIELIESLQDGVNWLVDYVELHSQRKGLEDLWRQLSEVAFEAEQIFDIHVVEQLQLRSQGVRGDLGCFAFNEDVETMIRKIDIIKREISSMAEEVPKDIQTGKQPRIVAPGSDSSATFTSGTSRMVGFDELMHDIVDQLSSDERDLRVIPISGMGGISKTTVASNVFKEGFIGRHFDIRLWVTISQEYSVPAILLGLLNDGSYHVKSESRNFHDIGEKLYQKLFNRRYLIVMDDVWDIEAWDGVRMFLPNNRNRSRVVITSRLTYMASALGCHNCYPVPLLDSVESWNLFCQATFGQEACPYPELEEVGKLIARNCKGLPLEIVVIGGQLARSDMTKEYWQSVAANMISFANAADYEHCRKVLYLSYSSLPIHLKLCFLYTIVYPEDVDIQVGQLIGRWIAEGFFRPHNGKDLEEIGKIYIKDLISRNLISWDGINLPTDPEDVHTCRIHDLFRDLCVREWEKENYIYSPKTQIFKASSSGAKDACCNCGNLLHDSEAMNHLESDVIPPLTSTLSLVSCKDCAMLYGKNTKLRLVKVANIIEYGSNGYDNFKKEVVQPTQVRNVYVDVRNYSFLKFISLRLTFLWNLQTLVFDSFSTLPVVLPPEIWEMPQLRRIHSDTQLSVFLPDPVDGVGETCFILKNLFSLNRLLNFKCTKEILARIPNLRELAIEYQDELAYTGLTRLHSSLCNLIHLQKLEYLWLKNAALELVILPNSLTELILKRCKIPWKDVSIIGSLPNLERLTLYKSGEGLEWTPVEGEFLQLKMLYVDSSNLRRWNADNVHFPMLQFLILQRLSLLEEIPSEIGDIGTLLQIFVIDCSELAIESAKKIWCEQKSVGNEILKITVIVSSEDGSETRLEDSELAEDEM